MFGAMLLVLSTIVAAMQAPPATEASALRASPPALVAQFETGKVQGEPAGLCWNADGTLYLRVLQSDAWGNQKTSHYLVETKALPSTLKATPAMPPWAATYWVMKTQLFSPKDASFKVDVDQRMQRAVTTNTPNAGDLAGMTPALPAPGGGQGGSAALAIDAANKSYQMTVTTMRVKGQVVGEWENMAPQPGMRFGWSPATAPATALAYVNSGKRLAIIDKQGNKQEVAGTSNALLPAWSTDGKRIAYLEKKDKKRYEIKIVNVE